MDAFVTRLADVLIAGVPTDDPTRAGVVRSGQLQDDPQVGVINILLHPGDKDWKHTINTYTESGSGIFAPQGTIMGDRSSVFWRRRFIVELTIFFENLYSRDEARRRANVVLSRAHWALVMMDMNMIEGDSFGEYPSEVQVFDDWIREGGGDGDFNWRGEMRIELLTEHQPVPVLP
jgi:hypothetical protein